MFNKTTKRLTRAFFTDTPCRITYRDKSDRWTQRVVRIETLGRDHIITRCEMRGGEYRRFNFSSIAQAKVVWLRPGRLRFRLHTS